MPKTLSGIQYLKATLNSFDIIEFFEYFHLTTKEACEQKFKDVIKAAAGLDPERENVLVKFAQNHLQNNFSVCAFFIGR
jgi:microcystin degradation protein MlrC